jgi:hypothetical protein
LAPAGGMGGILFSKGKRKEKREEKRREEKEC